MPAEKLSFYYLRLSQEDGDSAESCSIGSQRKCILNYLNDNGFDTAAFEEIADDGWSGTSMRRPGMSRLLALIAAGKVATVVVRDLSRFARNYLEAGHYLEYVFPLHGVRFISVNDGFDSLKAEEMTGGLEIAVRNLLNQMYSRDISRKIKSAVDLKKLSGEYAYGAVPYGYRKGERKNTIVIDEPAANTVRRIFELAASGETISLIARRMNDEGVPSPSAYLASVRGRYRVREFWTYESVRNILQNRIYTGDTVPFKSHVVSVGSKLVKAVPEELQEVIPDTHEAIISRELYYSARQVVKFNRKTSHKSSGNPFTSLLVCGCCGSRLTKGRPSNRSWLCASARYLPQSGCASIRVDETKLSEIVLRAIESQCAMLDARIKQNRRERGKHEGERRMLERECSELRRQAERLEDESLRRYEQYASGTLSRVDFMAAKVEASAQSEDIKLRLALVEERLAEEIKKEKSAAQSIDKAREITGIGKITELTPELTHALIKRIVASTDGSVRIEWSFRDELEAFAGDGEYPLTGTD